MPKTKGGWCWKQAIAPLCLIQHGNVALQFHFTAFHSLTHLRLRIVLRLPNSKPTVFFVVVTRADGMPCHLCSCAIGAVSTCIGICVYVDNPRQHSCCVLFCEEAFGIDGSDFRADPSMRPSFGAFQPVRGVAVPPRTHVQKPYFVFLRCAQSSPISLPDRKSVV